jgi:hypothetical protein
MWLGISVLFIVLVVSLVLRRWWVSGIALLGVAGGLAVLASQARMVPTSRAPLETAVSVAARASKPGIPSLPSISPSPTGSETVSTAAEAAQAIQRFRTAHTARAVSLADDGLPPVPLTPLPVPPDPDPATQGMRAGVADDPAGPAGASPPSASSRGGGFKACDALKAEIQAKLVAKGLTDSTLTILPRGDLPGHAVMGRCEGNTKMIVLTRSPPAP